MAAQTRQALLDAGIELLHEKGVAAGVGHIRLADVAHHAGYTTGAAYRCWDSQQDFHRDLAVAALQWRDRSSIADTIKQVRPLVDQRAPFLEFLRVGGESNVHRLPDESQYFTALALRASAVRTPELIAASNERVEEGLAAHAELYETLLGVFELRMRAPFTTAHLAAVLAAMAEGFAIQDVTGTRHPHLHRTDLGDGVGSDWTLFATAMQAILEFFTEPATPPPA